MALFSPGGPYGLISTTIKAAGVDSPSANRKSLSPVALNW